MTPSFPTRRSADLAPVRGGSADDQPDRPHHLARTGRADDGDHGRGALGLGVRGAIGHDEADRGNRRDAHDRRVADGSAGAAADDLGDHPDAAIGLLRSEEHTSELKSLMRISYAVFCLKKKNNLHYTTSTL